MSDHHASHVTDVESAKIARVEIDTGLRQFLLSVYNYMGSGLVLTGLVAYGAAETGLYAPLVKTPLLFWGVVLAPLVLVFLLSFRIEKMSLGAAQTAFWSYAGLVGLSLAGIFIVYTGVSIARTFFITAATFFAMSLYGYTTRTDLARFGSFLMMGLFGIIIASLVNLFLASSALQLAISVIGVVVFVGLTLMTRSASRRSIWRVTVPSSLVRRRSWARSRSTSIFSTCSSSYYSSPATGAANLDAPGVLKRSEL